MLIIIHVRIHHSRAITNSGIHKFTSGDSFKIYIYTRGGSSVYSVLSQPEIGIHERQQLLYFYRLAWALTIHKIKE